MTAPRERVTDPDSPPTLQEILATIRADVAAGFFFSRAHDISLLLAEVDRLEAAIGRVRALCDNEELDYAVHLREQGRGAPAAPWVFVAEVRAALDGGEQS